MKPFALPIAAFLVTIVASACGGVGSPPGGQTTIGSAPLLHEHRCTIGASKSKKARHHSRSVCDPTTMHVTHVLLKRRFRPRYTQQDDTIYFGGPVQTDQLTYLVFWGISGPSDTKHDPDGEAKYLIAFFNALGSSSWFNTITQYYQVVDGNRQYITNKSGRLAGIWYDTTSSPPPSTFTDAQVGAEAANGAAHFGYNAQANYVVVTPNGDSMSIVYADACAYHTMSSTKIVYTAIPYQPMLGADCGAGSVNDPGILDGVTESAAHEAAEAATDPEASGSGWYNWDDGEIADTCESGPSQGTTFPGGQQFPTQALWSNADVNCVQSYAGTSPSPTPSASPTPTPVPTPKSTPTPRPTPGAVNVTPGRLIFKRTGARFSETVKVAQSHFAGKFRRSDACNGVASVKTSADAKGKASYRITPRAAGKCTVKFAGGNDLKGSLSIVVKRTHSRL
jgi:hypothetical protein